MKELNIPFSLFDFFAVMLPGAVSLCGIYLFFNPALTQSGHDAVFSQIVLQRLSGDLIVVTSLVVISFLMGQVLNALSELLIDKPFNRLLGSHICRDLVHHNVKKAVQQHFGNDILEQSNRRTFIMIQSIIGANLPDAAATANRFIALAVMFESLALALVIVWAGLIHGYATGSVLATSFAGLVSAIIVLPALVALMLWSYRRYKSMWSQTFCMSFVAWVAGNIKIKKQSSNVAVIDKGTAPTATNKRVRPTSRTN
jgi:hypothetical protein